MSNKSQEIGLLPLEGPLLYVPDFVKEFSATHLDETHEFHHNAGKFMLTVLHQPAHELYAFNVEHEQAADDAVKRQTRYDLHVHADKAVLLVERSIQREVLRQTGAGAITLAKQYESTGVHAPTAHDVYAFSGIFESFLQSKIDENY